MRGFRLFILVRESWGKLFFEKKDSSLILRVRLTPNASACAVRGIFVDADGQEFLKINVVAVPEKGRANQELIKFLSKMFKIPKSEISLICGETDRCKKLLLPFSEKLSLDLEKLYEEG